MPESGGQATQSGIFYQNSIAALYLGRLLDQLPRPPAERVVEVRIEAPAEVDDIVVRFADEHREWMQAKLTLRDRGEAWHHVWGALARQKASSQFDVHDRLVIVLGEHAHLAVSLSEICERAASSSDEAEWQGRLSNRHHLLTQKIAEALTRDSMAHARDTFALLQRTRVDIVPVHAVERDFAPHWMPRSDAEPKRVLMALRDMAGGEARRRGIFTAPALRERLLQETEIRVSDPVNWGIAAYRKAIRALARIEVPGTAVSGSADELFIWPSARDHDRSRPADFEDDQPRWFRYAPEFIDLGVFPNSPLSRCIVVAGPGFGKTAMTKAISAKLSSTSYVPAVIPLASLSLSAQGVLEHLTSTVNRAFSVEIDWHRLCEQGLAVILFDGLDEVPSSQRQSLVERINQFAARFPLVPWMLTVRDASALAGPIQAKVVELLPLSDDDIVRFAEAYSRVCRPVDGWDFVRTLDAYPDLRHLTRIPLFLSLLLATHKPGESLPRSRAELIETYLKTHFNPEAFKVSAPDRIDPSSLRRAAEALAFDLLEREEIGATEHAILSVINRVMPADVPSYGVFDKLIRCGILRRQGSIRLEFPFPIVQEYLAARHLLEVRPEELPRRIGDAVKRPWAQTIQFALEAHPTASPLVRGLISQPDDAFYTGLRLIGRCVVNGMRVDAKLRAEIGCRLGSVWRSAPYRIRERVGRLLADGFTQPLLLEVRSNLGERWLLHDGAGEIVDRINDPSLTRDVLAELLDDDLEHLLNLGPLQPAVNRIGDEALRLYGARARRTNAAPNDLKALSCLVGHLSPANVSAETALDLALDENLPIALRLSAFRLGPNPLDDRALELLFRALPSEHWEERVAACRTLAGVDKKNALVFDLLKGDQLTDRGKHDLLSHLKDIYPDESDRLTFVHSALTIPALDSVVRDVLILIAARFGDHKAMEDLVDRLDRLPSDLAGTTISLFGHHRSRPLAIRAIERLSQRSMSSEEVPRFSSDAVIGMTSKYEMDWLDGGAVAPSPPHPARDAFAEIVARWSARNDLNCQQRLRVLTASCQLGSSRAGQSLEAQLTELLRDSAAAWSDHQLGHEISWAFRELQQQRRLLPLSVLKQIVERHNFNSASAAVSMIGAHGTREALNALIEAYSVTEDWALKGIILERLEILSGRFGLTVRPSEVGLSIPAELGTTLQ